MGFQALIPGHSRGEGCSLSSPDPPAGCEFAEPIGLPGIWTNSAMLGESLNLQMRDFEMYTVMLSGADWVARELVHVHGSPLWGGRGHSLLPGA